MPGRERQALLAQTRHFECKCATCLLPVEEASASDARRVRIRELLKKLEGARFPPRVPMEELEESLRWTREENMRMEEARLLLCGSQVLTIYSDLDAAIQWARDARRVFELIEGKESMNLRKVDDADRVHQMMAAAPRTLRMFSVC
ncbi:hypothetical protein WOLCODRAFT_24960 [Wolfiporia cocos MD-104 SS10]|uniref:Uncharacterized protein n=1 Tax=Wolfiporia cocos (strain MD-104) TaxID=742152 RepID=A0A2H3JSI1_WOLCO|nr:hypothetical protein WOLCODRAFT_24960 [Wolfiporia cocos MD-104 SS10]